MNSLEWNLSWEAVSRLAILYFLSYIIESDLIAVFTIARHCVIIFII
jgi:hypothetical protein